MTDISQGLVGDLGFYQFPQKNQRFLPTEITGFGRDHVGHAFLHDMYFSSARHFLQRHGHINFTGQVRVIEGIGIS